MNKILLTIACVLFAVALVCGLIFIGQGVEAEYPGNETMLYVVMYAFFGILIVCILGMVYEKGMKDASKEQEPDEVISRTGEEGVFLQPTGSHETDPFVK